MKRPQPKLPELKAPTFLANLFHDLRDRRLLPLVALVLVAIVATPILLSQESETEPPVGAGAIAALKGEGDRASELTVVEAKPGLREYRKRLRGRKPTDPFRPPTAKPSLKGAKLGGGGDEGSSSGSSTSTSTTVKSTKVTSTETTTTGGDGGSTDGSTGGAPPNAVFYTFAIDLTIVHTSGSTEPGATGSSETETRKRVLPTTPLPGGLIQVVTYMGLSPKTKKPFFLVSPEVKAVFGEGKCAAGTSTCELIEIEPGFPEVFEYGEAGDRYKLTITNGEFVVTGHA